jgi:mono/diheme cytochrome c family protein
MISMRKYLVPILMTVAVLGGAFWAAAQERAAVPQSASLAASNAASSNAGHSALVRSSAAERLEGEKRFKANCGRCHAAPQKYPRRAMATIVRHMRVRATLTDEDTKLILNYMDQ